MCQHFFHPSITLFILCAPGASYARACPHSPVNLCSHCVAKIFWRVGEKFHNPELLDEGFWGVTTSEIWKFWNQTTPGLPFCQQQAIAVFSCTRGLVFSDSHQFCESLLLDLFMPLLPPCLPAGSPASCKQLSGASCCLRSLPSVLPSASLPPATCCWFTWHDCLWSVPSCLNLVVSQLPGIQSAY